MKVLLLSKYPRMGASSRLRSLQYLPALAEEGIEVTVSSLFDEEYLRELYSEGRRSIVRSLTLYLKRLFVLVKAFKYDVVWIEKELFPYCPAIFERFLVVCGVRYLVDYDDAIFHNYDLANNGLIRKLLGRKIDVVMAQATLVIAGNQYLAERARKAGARRVEIIPTVVDHTRYLQADRNSADQLVIGWIGSPSTQRYVVDIQNAFRVVCAETGARLLLVGATESVIDKLRGIPVEIVPWTEESEVASIAQMDVGIMPLVDGPWENGKCGYKLIQYMAYGLPVVASPVGVNVDIVKKSECGRLVRSHSQWVDALIELLQSKALRETFGRQGQNAVLRKYSVQAQARVWAKIFASLNL